MTTTVTVSPLTAAPERSALGTERVARGETADGGSAEAGLTQMQTHIYISQGVPAYRLPFVYVLGADETIPSVQRRLRAAVAAAPSLACRYEHTGPGGGFVQRHAPELAESITVDNRGAWNGTVEQACEAAQFAPDIRRGLPIAASLFTVDGVAHLVVEFHHIAIDGPGAALFEELFLAESAPEPADAALTLAAYDRVAAHERTHTHSRVPATRPSPFPRESTEATDATCSIPSPSSPSHRLAPTRLGRLSVELPTAALRRFAREQRTFPRIALQAAFESWLCERQPGSGYAWVSSWRWTLGLSDIVGNFPVLLARPGPRPATLGERVADLMERTGDPEIGPEAEIADAAGVVFSYEDFRQGQGRYVPVDTFPRFALYLRVVVGPETTVINAEFDRRLVSTAVARDAVTFLADHCSQTSAHPRPLELRVSAADPDQPAKGASRTHVTEENR